MSCSSNDSRSAEAAPRRRTARRARLCRHRRRRHRAGVAGLTQVAGVDAGDRQSSYRRPQPDPFAEPEPRAPRHRGRARGGGAERRGGSPMLEAANVALTPTTRSARGAVDVGAHITRQSSSFFDDRLRVDVD